MHVPELFTAIVHHYKCYQDTYYDHNNLYYQLHAFNFVKIFSSSDILIVNKGGNILLIGFAFTDGMPELLMFIVINAVSIACIVFQYLIKNMISVSTSIMLHVKAA